MWIFQHIKFSSRMIIILFVTVSVVFYLYTNMKTTASHPVQQGAQNFLNKSFTELSSNWLKSNKTAAASSQVTEKFVSQKDGIYRFGSSISEVKLAVVLCGKRLNQTIVTLKSAIILSTVHLHYIIIADNENQEAVKNQLLAWPHDVLKQLSFEIHPITFPNGSDGEEWRRLFKLCACQRLFLPTLLNHIDSLIYVDTDVLFMSPVEHLWKYFYKMNKSHIAGLAPEHEDFATGWYNRFARHPYYEPLGVNSGVMLMNLTRMRAFKWETYLQPIMKEYKLKIVWGDQDIINIIFHFHSEKVYIFPCEWNFRPDHCMYSSVCKEAEANGVKVIHGNRGVYENDKQPVFKAIYEAMANYNIGTDLRTRLLEPMKKLMSETTNTNCGKLTTILTKSLENFITHKTEVHR